MGAAFNHPPTAPCPPTTCVSPFTGTCVSTHFLGACMVFVTGFRRILEEKESERSLLLQLTKTYDFSDPGFYTLDIPVGALSFTIEAKGYGTCVLLNNVLFFSLILALLFAVS